MKGDKFCGSGSVVERCLAKANVAGSNPVFRSIMVPSPSGKAKVCKTFIPRFKSGWYLHDCIGDHVMVAKFIYAGVAEWQTHGT